MKKNLVLYSFFSLLSLIFYSCIETKSSREKEVPQVPVHAVSDDTNNVVNLSGSPLPEKPLTSKVRRQREEELRVAWENYERDPDNIENIIWYGRRLAYLGEFHEAIRIYSVGLDKYPDSYRLLRHRGHRYITIRKFNEAIEDLQKAAFYSRTAPNQIEQDGLPNRLNKPLTNVKFNIWYHLGIAYYLKRDYDKAISSFKKCQTYSNNDDLLVAVTDWFYMTYKKIGNMTAAQDLLVPIHLRMNIVENYAYHQRLLVYKGLSEPESVLAKAEEADGLEPTLAYGIGNWYVNNGQVEEARNIYQRILLNPNWDAFAYIAAEADLKALQNL